MATTPDHVWIAQERWVATLPPLTYEPDGGVTISYCCMEVAEMVKRTGRAVDFTFNGTKVRANAGESPGALERIWHLTRTKGETDAG